MYSVTYPKNKQSKRWCTSTKHHLLYCGQFFKTHSRWKKESFLCRQKLTEYSRLGKRKDRKRSSAIKVNGRQGWYDKNQVTKRWDCNEELQSSKWISHLVFNLHLEKSILPRNLRCREWTLPIKLEYYPDLFKTALIFYDALKLEGTSKIKISPVFDKIPWDAALLVAYTVLE